MMEKRNYVSMFRVLVVFYDCEDNKIVCSKRFDNKE